MSSLLPIQKTIYSMLKSDTSLMSKIKGVFDDVPDNQAFPYIVIGDATEVPANTFGQNGYEATVTLHIWSRYKGFAEALQILDEVNRILDGKNIVCEGLGDVFCWYEFSETMRDPDGITRHIPVRYRIISKEV